MNSILTIDADTGEVVERAEAQTVLFHIPDDVDSMVAEANRNQRVAFSHHWRTAAVVYAWTHEPKVGKPSNSLKSENKLTLLQFSKLGIRGLEHQGTVAKYRRAAELAINQQLMDTPERGKPVALPAVEFNAQLAGGNHLAQGSGQNEWYTPQYIVERARAVMGAIDLDPASNPEANETVQAATYYTAEDDGLEHEWLGRVWLNPPYSRDLMPRFVAKLIEEYKAGRTTSAILVSHNNTETDWFQSLAGASAAICFPDTRIKFYRGEHVAAPVNGQVFFYLGRETSAFIDHFRPLGVVVACL
jgi:phage N-6-adenine-methyltransferase